MKNENETNPNLNEKPDETHLNRDIPLCFITGIHMNHEPPNGILELNVAINGGIVTGVEFLHDKQKLGSSFTRSIRKTVKGTWTDPQMATEILKKGCSKYQLNVGFRNHELKELANTILSML